MKRYAGYKDSGLDWLGERPTHWGFEKLKFNASVRFSNVDKKSEDEEEVVRLCNYVDVYYNDVINPTLDFMEATASSEEIRKFQLRVGDVLVTKDSEEWEDIAIPAYVASELTNVICGYHLAQIRPNANLIDGKFLFYLLAAYRTNYQFKVQATGVTRFGLSNYALNNSLIVIPSIQEQKNIAGHLDRKTAQTDALIAKKEQMIELLKEERTAIIDHTVTKGLNPKIKMKDSGIDWLGKISHNWYVTRTQYLGTFQNGISESAEYFGSGYPFISYGDVYNNMVLPTEVEGKAQSSDEERKKMSVEEGDILFTRTSETVEEIGLSSVCVQSLNDAIFSGFLIRFRPRGRIVTKEFSKYYFRSSMVRNFFVKEMNIVTRASLAQDLLKKLPVLLPPIQEQKEISEYLEKTCEQLDDLIICEQKSITLLKEFRTALISEVATGKIDVRE